MIVSSGLAGTRALTGQRFDDLGLRTGPVSAGEFR
jgi:hypothetical protein